MIRFRHRDESSAWDKYVSAAMASGLTVEKAADFADCILEERRARYMRKTDRAPPAEDDPRPGREIEAEAKAST